MTIPEIPVPVTHLREALHAIYEKAGLFKLDGKGCEHYEKCAASCNWNHCGRKILPSTGGVVGEKYGQEKIRPLFVGINTNEGSKNLAGFYDSYSWSSKNDSGIAGCMHRVTKRVLNEPDMDHVQTSEYFAFTNLIKCSVAKRAGSPTGAMIENCIVKKGTVFEEIKLLNPDVIFCLGDHPFCRIQNHFITTVEEIKHEFNQWLYSIKLNDRKIPVIHLKHPPQGYPWLRSAHNKIENGKPLADSLKLFIPDDPKAQHDLNAWLEEKYPENLKQHRIDTANPFYDLIFDTLWRHAKTYIQ